MPAFDATASAIGAMFADEFSAYPVAHQNVDFTPPVDGSGNPLPYVALHILEGEAVRAGGTGRTSRYRHPGEIKAQVFVPRGTGDGLAREIADTIATIFRGRSIESGGIRFYAPSFRANGPDGDMWQGTVSCRFEYDLIA